jgi:transposase InsO family protein
MWKDTLVVIRRCYLFVHSWMCQSIRTGFAATKRSPYYCNDQIKDTEVGWHVTHMGRKRNAYKLLVGEPERKRPVGNLDMDWENNIKIKVWFGYNDLQFGKARLFGRSCRLNLQGVRLSQASIHYSSTLKTETTWSSETLGFSQPHFVTTQKILLFIITDVRTSNRISKYILKSRVRECGLDLSGLG